MVKSIDLIAADSALRAHVTARAYRVTFSQAKLTADGDTLSVAMPNRFLARYVAEHHADAIESARAAAGARRVNVCATAPPVSVAPSLWEEADAVG